MRLTPHQARLIPFGMRQLSGAHFREMLFAFRLDAVVRVGHRGLVAETYYRSRPRQPVLTAMALGLGLNLTVDVLTRPGAARLAASLRRACSPAHSPGCGDMSKDKWGLPDGLLSYRRSLGSGSTWARLTDTTMIFAYRRRRPDHRAADEFRGAGRTRGLVQRRIQFVIPPMPACDGRHFGTATLPDGEDIARQTLAAGFKLPWLQHNGSVRPTRLAALRDEPRITVLGKTIQ